MPREKLGASQVGLVVEDPPANEGDVRGGGSISGLGRSPGGEHGNPLQYYCLENPMDRGAWWATVHAVTKSRTRLKQLKTHTHTHTHTHRWSHTHTHTRRDLPSWALPGKLFTHSAVLKNHWFTLTEEHCIRKMPSYFTIKI